MCRYPTVRACSTAKDASDCSDFQVLIGVDVIFTIYIVNIPKSELRHFCSRQKPHTRSDQSCGVRSWRLVCIASLFDAIGEEVLHQHPSFSKF